MIDVDLRLARGSFSLDTQFQSRARATGIVGPSGSGKTSFLMAVAGLLKPRSGHIIIDDRSLYSSANGIDLPPETRRVGVVFQDDRLFPHLSAEQNLLFGYRRTPPTLRRLQPADIIDVLGLEDILKRRTAALSGGEARRLAIGRALLTSPSLLILDEPLTGLDAQLRRTVLAYLIRLHERLDIRMLYVSHTVSDTMALVDAVARIQDGRLTLLGAPEMLLDETHDAGETGEVESVYQGTVSASDGPSAVVDLNGLQLTVRMASAHVGKSAVVTIRSEDVLLMTEPPPPSSARNVLHGRVIALRQEVEGVLATVDVGRHIYAALTHGAVRDLGLEIGTMVYALIKARALHGVTLPETTAGIPP